MGLQYLVVQAVVRPPHEKALPTTFTKEGNVLALYLCRFPGAVEKVSSACNRNRLRLSIMQTTCRGGLTCPP